MVDIVLSLLHATVVKQDSLSTGGDLATNIYTFPCETVSLLHSYAKYLLAFSCMNMLNIMAT